MAVNMEKCVKQSFAVVGIEGSTDSGAGFVKKLWDYAHSHFDEVGDLAKRDEEGHVLGIWGAMSDFSRAFRPWEENFSRGLYLAGIEAVDDAPAPRGWTKWVIPSYEYIYVKNEGPDTFSETIRYLRENQIPLAGAVNEFYCPEDGGEYLFFPVRRL